MPAMVPGSSDSPGGSNDSHAYEGLDLTSESSRPASTSRVNDLSAATNSNSASNLFSKQSDSKKRALRDVQVVFRCCKVHWRFPIPDEVLNGVKDSWIVHCPRCGGKLELP